MHSTGTKKPPGSRCCVTGGIEADSSASNHQNYWEYGKLVRFLVSADWDTLSHLPNIKFKAIMLIPCGIQGFAFQVLKTYSLFMCFASKEGILYRHFFAKNDFDP